MGAFGCVMGLMTSSDKLTLTDFNNLLKSNGETLFVDIVGAGEMSEHALREYLMSHS